MKRTAALLAIVLLTTFGPAPAKPVKPLLEPQKQKSLVEMSGTSWHAAQATGTIHVTFHADGTLRYERSIKGGPDKIAASGKWIVNDNVLVFDVNNYSEHRGFVAGNVIDIRSTNKAGKEFGMQLQRVLPAK